MTELERLRYESESGARSHELLLFVLDTIWLRLDDLPRDQDEAKRRIAVALKAHAERVTGGCE